MALDEEATIYVGEDETVYQTEDLSGGGASTDPGVSTDVLDRTGPQGATAQDKVERTLYASGAHELGALFRNRFSMRRYGVAPKRKLQLAGAVGVSTSGGEHARRYIVMVKEVNEAHGALVIGWIDSAGGRAQLRDYQRVSQQHHGRFKKPLELSPDHYARVLSELRDFLDVNQMAFDVEGPDPTKRVAPIKGVRQLTMMHVIVAGILLLGLGVMIGLWVSGGS